MDNYCPYLQWILNHRVAEGNFDAGLDHITDHSINTTLTSCNMARSNR